MSCLTPTRQDGDVGTHFDLAVIGTGSGNGIADDSFTDWEVAIIEQGVFGGTCLNRGCIPTKMLVYPADLSFAARHGPDLGVHTSFTSADWPAIRDRIFTRIDPISEGGRHWRAEGRSNVRLYEGHARFVDERTLDTGTGETITADHVVVATGSRPVIPDVPGLDDVDFHTSDTIMRIDALPARLLILGGGVISAEFAHVFSAFGSQVTVINRSELLLGQQDHEIAGHFTEQARRRWDLRLGRTVDRIEPWNEGLRAHLDDGSTVEADTLLVATGRRANSDLLGLDKAGVAVGADGLVQVDHHQRTTAPGVWALGDVSNTFQLKHLSNEEARVVQHNLLHPDDLHSTDHDRVPSAVFSLPQIASIGLTERQAEDAGRPFVVSKQYYGDTAYGWAMEDTTSFVKLVADPTTGLLLGAHLLGPQSANLIQPLIQAMSFRQRATDVARGQYWIHPALMEVVENALLGLGLD
ncbi:MAG: mycothione reductase [Nocardioidaceae bacterium]|nr:mycothione reductase [Nocardioidaceae bacterium]